MSVDTLLMSHNVKSCKSSHIPHTNGTSPTAGINTWVGERGRALRLQSHVEQMHQESIWGPLIFTGHVKQHHSLVTSISLIELSSTFIATSLTSCYPPLSSPCGGYNISHVKLSKNFHRVHWPLLNFVSPLKINVVHGVHMECRTVCEQYGGVYVLGA